MAAMYWDAKNRVAYEWDPGFRCYVAYMPEHVNPNDPYYYYYLGDRAPPEGEVYDEDELRLLLQYSPAAPLENGGGILKTWGKETSHPSPTTLPPKPPQKPSNNNSSGPNDNGGLNTVGGPSDKAAMEQPSASPAPTPKVIGAVGPPQKKPQESAFARSGSRRVTGVAEARVALREDAKVAIAEGAGRSLTRRLTKTITELGADLPVEQRLQLVREFTLAYGESVLDDNAINQRTHTANAAAKGQGIAKELNKKSSSGDPVGPTEEGDFGGLND